MHRTLTLAIHTFKETVLQPIFSLLVVLGIAVIVVFALLPYFTLGEDTRMFKSVAFDIVLLVTLVLTLMAASRSIYEEIEDRTMLTLLSKPVSRAEVLIGKYLGLIGSAAVAVLVMGLILLICVRERVPADYALSTRSIYDEELSRISQFRALHVAGIGPGLVAIWLQVSVLTAVSVAVSTRLPLVVNLPLVVMVYIAGNMTRFISGAIEDRGVVTRMIGRSVEAVVPFLQMFDLRDLTVFANIRVGTSAAASDPTAISQGVIWIATAWAAAYALLYVIAALSSGLLLMRNRDLGGGE